MLDTTSDVKIEDNKKSRKDIKHKNTKLVRARSKSYLMVSRLGFGIKQSESYSHLFCESFLCNSFTPFIYQRKILSF